MIDPEKSEFFSSIKNDSLVLSPKKIPNSILKINNADMDGKVDNELLNMTFFNNNTKSISFPPIASKHHNIQK